MPALTGKYKYHQAGEIVDLPDFNLFYKYTAAFPWHSHAAWYISQMIRWGDLPDSMDVKNIIKDIFWVDFHRQICTELGLFSLDLIFISEDSMISLLYSPNSFISSD